MLASKPAEKNVFESRRVSGLAAVVARIPQATCNGTLSLISSSQASSSQAKHHLVQLSLIQSSQASSSQAKHHLVKLSLI